MKNVGNFDEIYETVNLSEVGKKKEITNKIKECFFTQEELNPYKIIGDSHSILFTEFDHLIPNSEELKVLLSRMSDKASIVCMGLSENDVKIKRLNGLPSLAAIQKREYNE